MSNVKDLINRLSHAISCYQRDRVDKGMDYDPLYSVNIMINLILLAIDENRPILKEEEEWFMGGYYIAQCFDGTEYKDVYQYYNQLVQQVRKNNYYR